MRMNLDVFGMFSSVEPAGRLFASRHRVLRGEFHRCSATIKALRLPAAGPSALRCLRRAVRPRSLVLFAPRRTSAPPKPGVGNPRPTQDSLLPARRDWEGATGRDFHPQGSTERFQICLLHLIPLSQVSCRNRIDRSVGRSRRPSARQSHRPRHRPVLAVPRCLRLLAEPVRHHPTGPPATPSELVLNAARSDNRHTDPVLP
jgi:hypothetical protein